MLSFSNSIFSLCLLTSINLPLFGQQEPEFEIPADLGFLRIVNASGQPGPLWVTVNGVKLAAATGYEDGVATGAMGIQDKSLVLELRHDILGDMKQSVSLKAGVITSVIALTAKDPQPKEAGKEEEEKPELAIHLLELPVSYSDQPSTLSLIQFTPASTLTVDVAESGYALEFGKVNTFGVTPSMGAFIDVKLKSQIVAQLNFKDAAGQAVVLYTDPKGVVKSTQFRNDVQ